MSRFRKTLLCLVALLALAVPAALPENAGPIVPAAQAGQVRYYYVYYRSCPSDYWHYYGAYTRAKDAQLAVRWFNYYGYQAYYR